MKALCSFFFSVCILFSSCAFCENTVVFTDDTGAQVKVSSPQRVAALSGSLAELWLLSGGELACVSEDAVEERSLALSPDTVMAGSLKAPNTELLLEARVDFVLLTPTLSGHLELGEVLKAAGITVAYFDLETFEDYLRILDICTRITGHPENYQLYGVSVSEQVNQAVSQSAGHEAPTVLLIRAYSTGAKAKNSRNSMTGAMLADLGCVNIADSDASLLEDLSLEAILVCDPDFIFVTTMGADDEALAALAESLQSTPAWSCLTAVKEGRYYVLPKDLFHYKPNARWGESYAMLAEYLYGKQ